MPPKSGTTSRTSSTPGPLQAEAEALAEKVVFYCNTQSLSSDYLRSDVPRRDRMFEELARAPNAIPYGQDPEQDPLELLKAYDSSLAQKPVTYEDYFYRATYAFSAYMLYQVNVVDKALHERPKLQPIYEAHLTALEKAFIQETYGHLITRQTSPTVNSTTSTPLMESTVSENVKQITGEQAAREFLGDHTRLMQLQFILSAGTSEEIQWRVEGITLKPDPGKTEYAVKLSNCPEQFLLQYDEVVGLLCDSVVVH